MQGYIFICKIDYLHLWSDMVLYNQRLGNNPKEQNKTNIMKRGIYYENYNHSKG